MVTMKCYPWTYWDKVALVGDSAHAIVPFYGQGMNAGFEDCHILDMLLDQHADQWPATLQAFQGVRKEDGDAIAQLAVDNFIEMRDLVADPEFLLRKKIEARFSERHPDKWLPLYSMVTFSHIRYSEALKEGQRQDAIMAEVMAMDNIEQIWDQPEVESKMLELIKDDHFYFTLI